MTQNEIDKQYVEKIIHYLNNLKSIPMGNVEKENNTFKYSFLNNTKDIGLYEEFIDALKLDLVQENVKYNYIFKDKLTYSFQETLLNPEVSSKQLIKTFSLIENKSYHTNSMLKLLISHTKRKDLAKFEKLIDFLSHPVAYLDEYDNADTQGGFIGDYRKTELGMYFNLVIKAIKKFPEKENIIIQALINNVKNSTHLDDDLIIKAYSEFDYFKSFSLESFLEKTGYAVNTPLFGETSISPLITFSVDAKLFVARYPGEMLDFRLHDINESIEKNELHFPFIYLIAKQEGKYILGVENSFDNAIELAQQFIPMFFELKNSMPIEDIILKAKMEIQISEPKKTKMKI